MARRHGRRLTVRAAAATAATAATAAATARPDIAVESWATLATQIAAVRAGGSATFALPAGALVITACIPAYLPLVTKTAAPMSISFSISMLAVSSA